MPSDKLDLSVVICTYSEERWDFLVATIRSVQEQNPQPLEIILVVDHNPRLLERIHTQLEGVITIENSEDKGLSGARNSGIRAARGRKIAFFDDDVLLEPNCLNYLDQRSNETDILGVGGKILPTWLSARPNWFPEEFNWVVGCSYRGLPLQSEPIRNPLGACMCIRREVFDKAGGFRYEIGHNHASLLGCEETEFAIRARQCFPGKQFIYEPQAQVLHKVPASRAQWGYFERRCYAEGLSKARVARFVGSSDGLSSERAYTLRTLPKGFLEGCRDAVLHGDIAGIGRSTAIVAGLFLTASGYIIGKFIDFISGHREQNSAPTYS